MTPHVPKTGAVGSWIIEKASTGTTGGGTTPPLPTGDPTAAPNILDATVSAYLEGGSFGFTGLIMLPTAAANYSNLKRIDVIGTYPPGQAHLLATLTGPWAGGTVPYKALVGPQVTVPQNWVLTYPVYNAAGTVTTNPLTRSITVTPRAVASVTANEIGARYADEDKNLHTVIGIVPSFPDASFPQEVTIWLQYGDGVDIWQGWYTLNGPGEMVKIGEGTVEWYGAPAGPGNKFGIQLATRHAGGIYVPTNPDFNLWACKVAAGRINSNINPTAVGAVTTTFTVTPVGVCDPHGITDAHFVAMPSATLRDLSADRTILYSRYDPGVWCWIYYGIEFTSPSFLADNNYWESEMTVQKGYTQTGTGTVQTGIWLTAAPGSFAAQQVGFEIKVNGVLTTITGIYSDSVLTFAAAQPDGAGKSWEIFNEAPDDEGVNEDPFLHYRGRRFFSSPQLHNVPDNAVQVITSHGANPANWKIPHDKNDDDSINIFREFRIRIYNVSRLGTDSTGAGGRATHSLQTVAWGGQDHGTLIPVAPGHILDLRNLKPQSIGDALGGGNGHPLKVLVAAPLFIDIATNSVAISISGDLVVVENPPGSGHYELSQKVVDLAKAINFDVTNFKKAGGAFLVNQIAVNSLIAGDALFTGDTTFAYSPGGGKVTLNGTGVTLQDKITAPSQIVNISSAGFQAAHSVTTPTPATNKVIVSATGVQVQSNIDTGVNNRINTLTMTSTLLQLAVNAPNSASGANQAINMDASSIWLYHATTSPNVQNSLILDAGRILLQTYQASPAVANTLVIDASKIELTKGGVNAPVLTLNASGLTATAGSYATTVTGSKVELTGPNGYRVTTTSDSITVYADASHYVEVKTTGVNIVGGTFAAPSLDVTTSGSYRVQINASSLGVNVTLGTTFSNLTSTGIQINTGTPPDITYSRLDTNTLLVGRVPNTPGDTNYCELRSGGTIGGPCLLIGGVTRISNAGAATFATITGTSLNVGSGSVTCGTLSVTTFSPASISTPGTCNASNGFTGGAYTGSGVDVGINNHVYASYIATNQYGGGVNKIDTGTLNASVAVNVTGTVTCNTLSVTTFNPSSISTNFVNIVGSSTDGLKINGQLRVKQDGVWLGSVSCPDHIVGNDFGINGIGFGWPQGGSTGGKPQGQTSTFPTGDGRTVTVSGGLIMNVF